MQSPIHEVRGLARRLAAAGSAALLSACPLISLSPGLAAQSPTSTPSVVPASEPQNGPLNTSGGAAAIPAAQAGAAPALEWRPLNRLELAVNDDAFTYARIRAGRSNAQVSEVQLQQEVERMASDVLMAQAGHDLGFSGEIVQSMVQGELARRQEVAGSAAQLADELAERRWTSTSYVEDAKSYIHRTLFVRSVTGRDAGPAGRPYVDRFVRPGRLWLEHQLTKEQPVWITFSAMQFHLSRYGSLEEARDAALAMVERLEAGEDFAQLAEQYELCEPKSGGKQKPVRLEKLAAELPEFFAFARDAKVGDLSAPLEWGRGGSVDSLIVLRLADKSGGGAGPFENALLQQALREQVQSQLDDFHVDQAMGRLFRSAYIDPKPTPRAK